MLERQTHPRRQGDLGEADAIRWLSGPKYAAYEVGEETGWLLREGPF